MAGYQIVKANLLQYSYPNKARILLIFYVLNAIVKLYNDIKDKTVTHRAPYKVAEILYMEIAPIIENSFFARIARVVLRSRSVAMVLGGSIHLSGATREAFLRDPRWVAHEMCHIRQYQQYGRVEFLRRYLRDWLRYGYYHIPFEAEARRAGDEEAHLYANGCPVPPRAQSHKGAGEA